MSKSKFSVSDSSPLTLRSRMRVECTVRPNGSKSVVHYFDCPSKTRQEFKDDCNINLMVKRFTKTNRMNNTQFMNYMVAHAPKFGEGLIEGSPVDYQTHLQAQLDADEMFMSLPSTIRNKFNNDPGQFLDFAFKPENRAQLADMGLLNQEATRREIESRKPVSEVLNPKTGDSQSPANPST